MCILNAKLFAQINLTKEDLGTEVRFRLKESDLKSFQRGRKKEKKKKINLLNTGHLIQPKLKTIRFIAFHTPPSGKHLLDKTVFRKFLFHVSPHLPNRFNQITGHI